MPFQDFAICSIKKPQSRLQMIFFHKINRHSKWTTHFMHYDLQNVNNLWDPLTHYFASVLSYISSRMHQRVKGVNGESGWSSVIIFHSLRMFFSLFLKICQPPVLSTPYNESIYWKHLSFRFKQKTTQCPTLSLGTGGGSRIGNTIWKKRERSKYLFIKWITTRNSSSWQNYLHSHTCRAAQLGF